MYPNNLKSTNCIPLKKFFEKKPIISNHMISVIKKKVNKVLMKIIFFVIYLMQMLVRLH